MDKKETKEGMITVRLSQGEIDQLDAISKGQLSRSAVIRALVRDFLEKPDKAKKKFLFDAFFGE